MIAVEITEFVQDALADIDVDSQQRLQCCLPMLSRAIADWDGVSPGGLLLACATPRAALLLTAVNWPDVDPKAAAAFDCADAALALIQAVESRSRQANTIITAARVLLGEPGIAAHAADVAEIKRLGQVPVTVLLLDRRGKSVALLATAVGVDAVTVH